jgi:hypothetical protein
MTKLGMPRYDVTAYWGPRAEGPEDLVEPFLRTLDALSQIDPAFSNWYFLGRRKGTLMAPLSRDDVVKLIATGVSCADDGDPTPINGYGFGAANGLKRTVNSLDIRINAGSAAIANFFINSAIITTAPFQTEYAPFINARIMKAALLVLVAEWKPTWCGVRSSDLFDIETTPVPPRPHFGLAWMTYLSKRFAPMVTPPSSALVERPSDGGLLMIATLERFSAANPQHLAVARDIEAALAPVNALPWPPDA